MCIQISAGFNFFTDLIVSNRLVRPTLYWFCVSRNKFRVIGDNNVRYFLNNGIHLKSHTHV